MFEISYYILQLYVKMITINVPKRVAFKTVNNTYCTHKLFAGFIQIRYVSFHCM